MENPFASPTFNTDKIQNGLMEEYKSILRPLIHCPVTLLEVGIARGGSILYWDDFFRHPDTRIIGIDIKLPDIEMPKRVTMHVCDQNDRNELVRIARSYGQFDLIIDDGSHQAKETRTCFDALYPFLKLGGYYVIEDWAVGYFNATHPQYEGMIDVITEILHDLPSNGIESTRIICEPGKAMAFFQRGR